MKTILAFSLIVMLHCSEIDVYSKTLCSEIDVCPQVDLKTKCTETSMGPVHVSEDFGYQIQSRCDNPLCITCRDQESRWPTHWENCRLDSLTTTRRCITLI